MYKKLTIWVLMFSSLVIFVPSTSVASPAEENKGVSPYEYSSGGSLEPQTRRRRRRGWDDNWRWRNRNRRLQNRNRSSRLVRQVYWRNGRRYVRYVRVYYR